MKKIIFLFILLLSVKNVYAIDKYDTFHLADKINNVYITRYNNANSRNGAIYIIKDSSNNPVYCIEPFQPNLDSSIYEGYYDSNKFNITKEQLDRINLISYYGYGYENFIDSKWYIITQALIWRELGLNTYFTSVYHGAEVEMFDSEMKEILDNVNKHSIQPNFEYNSYNIGINSKLEIIDNNNILKYYDIETNNIEVKAIDNKLIIEGKKEGTYKIKLVKKDSMKSNNKVLYYSANSQNVFLPGKFDDIVKYIDVNVYSGSININTKGDGINISNAEYNLYDLHNNLIDTYTSDVNGNITLNNLNLNTYYIKQIKSNLDYEIDDSIYEITLSLNNRTKNLNIINKKKKIDIIKQDNNAIVDNKNINNSHTISIPNTSSNCFKLGSVLCYIFITTGLGVIILYAKKE